eukprot:Opistho-1_new@7222
MTGPKEDFKVTPEEMDKLEKAFKDEKFRKMFMEYMDEISDPENKKKYEEEILRLEAERGVNAKFLHPTAGFVVKTREAKAGGKKVLINVCSSPEIQEAKGVREQGGSGTGIRWTLPHSLVPARDDKDKAGEACVVYDVVFHPDTVKLGAADPRFKDMLAKTAMEGVAGKFGVVLEKKYSTPKMSYKGTPSAAIIREATASSGRDKDAPIGPPDLSQKLPKMAEAVASAKPAEKKATAEVKVAKDAAEEAHAGFRVPKYSLTHRGEFDMGEFVEGPASVRSSRPKELVYAISLPLLNGASEAVLDVRGDEKVFKLTSEAPSNYLLEIALPYEVDDENGSAKFDKKSKVLTVTLPVKPAAPAHVAFADAPAEPEVAEVAAEK